jgi:sortase A
MLAWCAWVLVDASWSQQAARRSLETASPAGSLARPSELSDPTGVAPGARAIEQGSAVAALTISRIGLSAVVLHGSDERTLRRGPGHLEHTAVPGERGNVVIAGHRDTFFRPLRRIRIGDEIVLETPRGRVEYRVSSLRVTGSDDLSVLAQGGRDVLTLITCHPFDLVGAAPNRFVVGATRVTGSEAGQPATAEPRQEPINPLPAARALDDRALVREALERFRWTYNARLVSHGELGRRGFLQWQPPCRVVVTGDLAAATCVEPATASDDATAQDWTIALARAETGWAIRSIAID